MPRRPQPPPAVCAAARQLGLPPADLLAWAIRADGWRVLILRSGQKYTLPPDPKEAPHERH